MLRIELARDKVKCQVVLWDAHADVVSPVMTAVAEQ